MKFKKNKKAIIICSVILGVILLGLGFIMFSGNVEINYGEDSFTLDSMYASPLTIKYSDISGVWYTEDYIEGDKVNGFNSARLMVGKYENEALRTYDRYTYTGNNAFVVVETTDKDGKLHYTVIGGNSFSETKEIYNTLSADYGFDITYQEDSFTITPSHGEAVIVKHSQVGSTQYRPEYIDGEKKSGFETNEIMMGEYQNDEYGKYKRFSYYDTDAYIIIEILENGETVDYVVFNEDSIEKTSALYDELSEKVVG